MVSETKHSSLRVCNAIISHHSSVLLYVLYYLLYIEKSQSRQNGSIDHYGVELAPIPDNAKDSRRRGCFSSSHQTVLTTL